MCLSGWKWISILGLAMNVIGLYLMITSAETTAGKTEDGKPKKFYNLHNIAAKRFYTGFTISVLGNIFQMVGTALS